MVKSILRAAEALADLSHRDLAANAGLRLSRTKRIMSGHARPKPDEIKSILAGAGIPPTLLTAHIKKRLVPGIASCTGERLHLLVDLLSVQQPQPLPSISPVIGDVLIDKLTLTLTPTRWKSFCSLVGGLPQGRPSNLYHQAHKIYGIWIELEPVYQRQARVLIRFNPARLKPIGWHHAQQLVAFAPPSLITVSRVDPAIDLALSIHDYQPLATRKRKVEIHIGVDGVETIYLGAKRSVHRYRVYARDKLHPSRRPTLRLEVQVKPRLSLRELSHLPNPFRSLTLLPVIPTEDLPLEQRLLMRWCRFYGLPALKAELGPKAFKTLKAEWEERAANIYVPDLITVFDQGWSKAVDWLHHRLGIPKVQV